MKNIAESRMNQVLTLERGTLCKHDIIEYEPQLKNAIASFLPFTSYSLTFPTSVPREIRICEDAPHGRARFDKGTLQVPLAHEGRILAIFAARGVDKKAVRGTQSCLPTMAALSLEQIRLHKAAATDHLTGLFNRHSLEEALTREISGIVGAIMPGPGTVTDDSVQGHNACFGLIMLDLDRFRQVNDKYGYLFGDRLMQLAADQLREICPPQTMLCRLDGDCFGVLWPLASRARLAELALELGSGLSRISARFTPLREDVGVSASIGYVNYPQDFQGAQFQKPPAEQSRLVLGKAEKALTTAKAGGSGQVYSYRQILTQGGVVLEVMPMDRIVVSLGRSVDAHEGQRFVIWSRKFKGRETITGSQGDLGHYPPTYKAEISLVEVQEELAIAEVLVQTDPDQIIEPGDRLTLLDDHSELMEPHGTDQGTPRRDPLTGLYPYRDFLRVWQSIRGQSSTFTMLLMRIELPHAESPSHNQMQEEQLFQTLAGRAQTLFGSESLGGRYSMNCIIYHIPELDQTECARMVHELLEDERFAGMSVAAGIASWPFLGDTRSETLDNARKALDHASMLHGDRIACFDSVSLNISADRLFAQGEIFDAIAEYKRALTVDEDNLLARNSLGVCYARMNKYAAARSVFQELTDSYPENVMPLYNYGCACLKDNDPDTAGEAFARVLSIQPDHVYALLRLGLMAEDTGDLDRARDLFEQVRALPGGERLAYRYLARLAFQRNDRDTAREFLHQAITTNPQDAQSFHLLATIYLERGDDPEVAESLARQSVHLKPDTPAHWNVLITALEQQGKTAEAEQIKIRAAAQTC